MKHVARNFALAGALALVASQAFAAGSVPQMNPSSFPNQLFWLAITFVALYVVVSRFVVPSVSSVLDLRDATIADAIAKAEAFKQHAEQTRGSFEAASQQARAKAGELLAAAQQEAAQKQNEAIGKLNAQLEQQSAKAQAALGQAVAQAKGDLDAAAAQVAHAIAEKLLGSSVDEASVKAALKKAA